MNLPLFGPEAPIRGLNSYVDPMYLPDGFWQELKNVRWDRNVIKVRDGDEAVLTTPEAGTFHGAGLFSDESSGFLYLYVAIEVSGKLRFHRILYDVANGTWENAAGTANTWDEVTSDSGKYGDTRYMDPPDSGYVQFVRAPIPEGGGVGIDGFVVVAMNGKDEPLKLTSERTGTAWLATCKVEDVEAPTWASGVAPIAKMSSAFDVTSPTPTSSGSGNLQRMGSTHSTIGGGGSNSSVTLAYSDTLDLFEARQIVLIVQGDVDEFLDTCRIKIGVALSNETIYDPTDFYQSYVRFDGTQDQCDYTLLAFDIPDGSRSADDRIIIEEVSSVSAGFMIDFKMIAASGRVPGSAQYACSYYNQGSRTESAGVVMRSVEGLTVDSWLHREAPYSLQQRGITGLVSFGFKVPVLPNVYYEFEIPMTNPSLGEIYKGVQTLNFYRSDAVGERFYYTSNEVLTSYTGSWSVKDGSAGASTGTTYKDNRPTSLRDYGRVAPTAFNQAWPKSVAGIYGNNRVYVGGYKDGSADSPSTVFVSEQNQPMRYSKIADFDQSEINLRTAFTADLGERIRAFEDVSASVVGSSGVYVFTDRGLYTISDWQVRRLASTGAIGTDAVCSYEQEVYFVDEDLVVRVMAGGGIAEVSRMTVHDKLSGAIDPDKMSLAVFGDRLYVAYQDDDEGTAGNRVLVWNRVLRAWESCDTTATGKTVARFVPFRYKGDNRLLFCAPDGDVFRYEDPNETDLDGADIPFEIRTREFKGNLFKEVSLGQLGILADDTTGTLSIVRTARNRGTTTTQSSTISLDSTNNTNWREDDAHRAIDGFSGDYKISANLGSGLTLRAVYARISGAGHGSD